MDWSREREMCAVCGYNTWRKDLRQAGDLFICQDCADSAVLTCPSCGVVQQAETYLDVPWAACPDCGTKNKLVQDWSCGSRPEDDEESELALRPW